MKNPTISPTAAVAVIVATVVLAGIADVAAVGSRERRELAPRRISQAECLQCHNTPRGRMLLEMKEGNCSFIFKSSDKKGVQARFDAYVRAHPNSTPLAPNVNRIAKYW